MAASVYSRAFRKAAELVGGRDKLAEVLQAPRADIDRWISDEAKPSREVFLRIVDLVLDDGAPGRELDERSEPPARDAAGGRGVT